MNRSRQRPLSGTAQCLMMFWSLLLFSSVITLVATLMSEPFFGPSLRWIDVRGEVVHSGHRVVEHDDGLEYEPVLEYRYPAGGHWETSRAISVPPPRFATLSEVEEWLEDHRVGDFVTVYYRETLSHAPLLDRGFTVRWVRFVLSLIGTVIAAVGLRWQWSRNAVAYLEGRPRPTPGRRTPRPIRAAEAGEHHAGDGNRRTLRQATRSAPPYRGFQRD